MGTDRRAISLPWRIRERVVAPDARNTNTEQLRPGGGAGPQVLVLTTFDSDAMVVRALCAGAAGHLLEHTEPERIVEAVRRAAAKETPPT